MARVGDNEIEEMERSEAPDAAESVMRIQVTDPRAGERHEELVESLDEVTALVRDLAGRVPDVDLAPVLSELKSILTALSRQKAPEFPTDELTRGLEAIRQAVTEKPEPAMGEIAAGLDALHRLIASQKPAAVPDHSAQLAAIEKKLGEVADGLRKPVSYSIARDERGLISKVTPTY